MTEFISLSDIESAPAGVWPNTPVTPFMRQTFLAALERNGCVGPGTGWTPSHFCNDDLLIPAYVKDHSYGEYVFDWSWAEAYARYGMDYYPKLLLSVPFTPVPGPATSGGNELPDDFAAVLNEHCHSQQLSGWHLNFTNSALTEQLKQQQMPDGPHQRTGVQFHWFNRDYESFEHYLAHFVSRKRKNTLKERRSVSGQGYRCQRLTGTDIEAEHIHFFYQCYLNTYRERRSTPYLNEDFFQQLRQQMSDQMLLVICSNSEGPAAAALCFYDQTHLYGRYWGALVHADALHFEACYYQGIEFCIEKGLKAFNPGTQGEHKIARGFEPVLTHSFHWLAHPGFHQAVGDFVQEERQHILQYQQAARAQLPFHRAS